MHCHVMGSVHIRVYSGTSIHLYILVQNERIHKGDLNTDHQFQKDIACTYHMLLAIELALKDLKW